MTEIVTISPITAAYATQSLKASARVSGSSPAERTLRQLASETMRGEDGPMSTMDIVGTSAMTLFFLTSGQKRNQPQTSRRQAEEEYLLNNLDETLSPSAEAREEEQGMGLGDIPELAPPVLALPDLTDEA
ncbi:hypothetical protein JJB09_17640 [Rhizobium sp. KVB221]|uniref:Uncharacterized protein n=1 Tax=Rhizobium setariae TaxID=2801340 RepID=A0A936YT41_9HYPH|nr:hypothetical protein [Rhizobium setariae]MBL0373849.1 hypothetical protein [Rhizobium setariae]